MISKHITRTIVIVLVVFALLAVTAVGFYMGFTFVLTQNNRFEELQEKYSDSTQRDLITADTPGVVEIVIPRAADTQKIAEILKDMEVIENTFFFTVLSKFNGFDGMYMAGTHYVLPAMNYDEIMYMLAQKPQSVRVTFPEGLTYSQVKERLREANVNFDEDELDNMVRNPQLFLDYDFVRNIENKDGRDWLLQGYLYPDTYEFDINTDEETIIRTFLNNTQRKLLAEYDERAASDRISMSMDEIITLASIIQIESAKIEEMRTVSGVFHNRLNREGWTLSACATVNYLRLETHQDTKLWLSDEDIAQFENSPYNTYIYLGLPPGPICSPGEDAIRAALWPENHNFYFFSATGKGENVFARTFEEHERNIAQAQRDAEQD